MILPDQERFCDVPIPMQSITILEQRKTIIHVNMLFHDVPTHWLPIITQEQRLIMEHVIFQPLPDVLTQMPTITMLTQP